MIYGGDKTFILPVMDLYDKGIMLMSIAAARDMYEKGQQQLKDFYKEYGDFMSPILKDMDWYNRNVTGKVRDTINNLYANGIDPLRSAEGRAAISLLIYSMPTGDIAKLRLSAAAAEEYIKNRGKLEAAGLYNPDAEENYLGYSLNNYSTLGDNETPGNGVWNRTAPIENKTMDEIIEPIIKNLDYSYDEARTKQANDGNDYYTVSEDRIRATIADAMKDLTNKGTMGGYYYNQALLAAGGDPDKARDIYTEWLVNRGKDHLKEKFTPNKWKEMAQEHKYRMAEKAYAASLRGSRSGRGSYNNNQGSAYDFATDIYDKGLNNIAGAPGGQAWELGPGGKYVDAEQYFNGSDKLVQAQRDFGRGAAEASKKGSDRWKMYRDRFTHTKGLSGETFAKYMQRDTYKGKVGTVDWNGRGVTRLEESDLKRIRPISAMITNTAGYTATYRNGTDEENKMISKMKENPSKYLIGGNNIDVYGAYNKPGRYQNDFIISVYDRETGKKVGEVAYDSYINSSRTTGGLYEANAKNGSFDASSARELSTRQFVTQGSTNVNNWLKLSRKQQMPNVYPMMDTDDDIYYDED